MFFTPELLSKRDSGFGLLWLAATLGSRSAFKKLPKRSVMTADIAQLCDLISQPAEPLALRLSSNLMFGVVRVYKVKQEIFMTDVSNCVTSLKKVVQDLRTSGAHDGNALMPNPVARPATVTIVPDPRSAYALDFDALVVDWDAYLNLDEDENQNQDDADEDFDPKATGKNKKNGIKTQKPASAVEAVRREVHTLQEDHEQFLSASFELSFAHNSAQGLEPSSSHVDGGFDFFFPMSDGLDIGAGPGLGEDLARELGWNVSPAKSARSKVSSKARGQARDHVLPLDDTLDIEMNQDPLVDQFNFDEGRAASVDPGPMAVTPQRMTPIRGSTNAPTGDIWSPLRGGQTPNGLGDAESPSQSLEQGIQASEGVSHVPDQPPQGGLRKLKRTRLLLDARIELTDDELKIARARYLECQKAIKRDMAKKQLEKTSGKMIEELIWGAPKQLQCPALISFWEENLRVQVEMRSGQIHIHEDQPANKRRKITPPMNKGTPAPADFQQNMANEMNGDWDFQPANDMGMMVDDIGDQRQSSEEPGRGRRGSRASSVVDPNAFALDLGLPDKGKAGSSQKSSLFPWDNAIPSSSSGNVPYGQPEGSIVPDMVDVRIRSRPMSRRGSPLIPSGRNSMNTAGMSPIIGGRGSHPLDDDFMFNEQGPATQLEDTQLETQQDTQKTDANLITLERNSFNFLEYAKMQCQTLPQPDGRLTFEKVTPQMTSTRHVAAAAFYHCLVLSTRNLLHLEQKEPYGDIFLDIVQ